MAPDNETKQTATFIAPDHFGPVELTPNMTLEDALNSAGLDGDCIVKLDGNAVDLTAGVVADAIYLIVPGNVAKGGFDGGAN